MPVFAIGEQYGMGTTIKRHNQRSDLVNQEHIQASKAGPPFPPGPDSNSSMSSSILTLDIPSPPAYGLSTTRGVLGAFEAPPKCITILTDIDGLEVSKVIIQTGIEVSLVSPKACSALTGYKIPTSQSSKYLASLGCQPYALGEASRR